MKRWNIVKGMVTVSSQYLSGRIRFGFHLAILVPGIPSLGVRISPRVGKGDMMHGGLGVQPGWPHYWILVARTAFKLWQGSWTFGGTQFSAHLPVV